MGKPYQRELDNVPATIRWALAQDVASLRHTLLREFAPRNLIAVGSGGSLVAATFAAMLHEATTGRLARATTPLEASTRPVTKHTAALLLSARGTNIDIQQAAKFLPQLGYEPVAAVSTFEGSPLGPILGDYGATCHEFPVPTGRDGFLATNSLMATMLLLHRASMPPGAAVAPDSFANSVPPRGDACETVLNNPTLLVLAQGWARPAALDLETRFSEAALANVIVTDPRNFAHGRHHWLSVHSNNTGIISLETKGTQGEASRMIRHFPETIDVLRVKSQQDGPSATVELLLSTMELAGTAGRLRGIDPGKPRVAGFGRRLYRAGSTQRINPVETAPIARKRAALHLAPTVDRHNLETALRDFIQKIEHTTFHSLVTDYDGTLCRRDRRFEPPESDIQLELNRLLAEGVHIGIASGRGGSMYEHLRHTINKCHWKQVTVGMYNGARVIKLSDDWEKTHQRIPSQFNAARRRLEPLKAILGFDMTVRQHQITLQPTGAIDPYELRTVAREHLAQTEGISLIASSHSVDIVMAGTSKTAVVDALHARQPGCVLRIGDQGSAGGNDFELLNTGLSLSVDRVSSSLETCWYLGKPGHTGPSLTLQYLRAIRTSPHGFRFDTSLLPVDSMG